MSRKNALKPLKKRRGSGKSCQVGFKQGRSLEGKAVTQEKDILYMHPSEQKSFRDYFAGELGIHITANLVRYQNVSRLIHGVK